MTPGVECLHLGQAQAHIQEHTLHPQCPPSQEKVPGSVPRHSIAMDQAQQRRVTQNLVIQIQQIQHIVEANMDQVSRHPLLHGGQASQAQIQTHLYRNMEVDQ